MTSTVRTDWTFEEVKDIYNKPLFELVYQAMDVHKANHEVGQI